MTRTTAGIGAVILAAGASTRFGSPKQLAIYNGESLVRRAANAALAAGADPIVVVVGAHADLVAGALRGLDVRMIVNEDWESGIASSLRVGLESLIGSPCDAALAMLADQPGVDAKKLRSLMERFEAGNRLVAASYSGTIGVPAIFGREHFPELMLLAGDKGAGGWLRKKKGDVSIVPMEDAAVDIDAPSDI